MISFSRSSVVASFPFGIFEVNLQVPQYLFNILFCAARLITTTERGNMDIGDKDESPRFIFCK